MKHTILTCAKFKRLKHKLSHHMECTIIGALESLFLYAGANGPVMAAQDVEAICGWTCGEDGVLLAALSDTGGGAYTNFLDILEDGRVEIHNYWEHAPDCVKTRERQKQSREAKRHAHVCDSHATVTQQSRNSHESVRDSNDKPKPKPNQTINTKSTNVLLSEPAPKPVQGKLKGTQRTSFADKAAASGYWHFHNLYPKHRHMKPETIFPLWEAAIKGSPEETKAQIMGYLKAMIDCGEYTKENGKWCPGMKRFFEEEHYLRKPLNTDRLGDPVTPQDDDDMPPIQRF